MISIYCNRMKLKFLIVYCMLFACTNKNLKKRTDIIKQNDFADILKAVHIIEAEYEFHKTTNKEYAFKNLQLSYDSVYNKYGITAEIFQINLNHFSENPSELEQIYSKILNDLTKERGALP